MLAPLFLALALALPSLLVPTVHVRTATAPPTVSAAAHVDVTASGKKKKKRRRMGGKLPRHQREEKRLRPRKVFV